MLRLALVLLVVAVLLPAVACSSTSPSRSYAFGRHGGNIQPWTARISAGRKISVAGAAARTRTVVPRLGMTNLAKRFDVDRFFALPAKIRCRKQLPDFATVWITARRGTQTHTVDAQLGCSARFDSALGALRSVSRVKAP